MTSFVEWCGLFVGVNQVLMCKLHEMKKFWPLENQCLDRFFSFRMIKVGKRWNTSSELLCLDLISRRLGGLMLKLRIKGQVWCFFDFSLLSLCLLLYARMLWFFWKTSQDRTFMVRFDRIKQNNMENRIPIFWNIAKQHTWAMHKISNNSHKSCFYFTTTIKIDWNYVILWGRSGESDEHDENPSHEADTRRMTCFLPPHDKNALEQERGWMNLDDKQLIWTTGSLWCFDMPWCHIKWYVWMHQSMENSSLLLTKHPTHHTCSPCIRNPASEIFLFVDFLLMIHLL